MLKKISKLICGIIEAVFYYLYGYFHHLPGMKFNFYAKILAIRGFFKGLSRYQAFHLFVDAVFCVRYFEFDFIDRGLKKTGGVNLLDISSPRLLPIYLADKGKFNVTMVNPDKEDLTTTKYIIDSLGKSQLINFGENIDARKLPYKDSSFDVAISISVIEHISDDGDKEAVREFIRVVRPGGMIMLTFPVAGDYQLEYKDKQFYSTQERDKVNNQYFFQRVYSQDTIKTRLINDKVKIVNQKYYVESFPGSFNICKDGYLKEGLDFTIKDPMLMYKFFKGPGIEHPQDRRGVCCLQLIVDK